MIIGSLSAVSFILPGLKLQNMNYTEANQLRTAAGTSTLSDFKNKLPTHARTHIHAHSRPVSVAEKRVKHELG